MDPLERLPIEGWPIVFLYRPGPTRLACRARRLIVPSLCLGPLFASDDSCDVGFAYAYAAE